MPFDIKLWSNIAPFYSNNTTLLLGNGASIAVDNRFSYLSIIEHARENGFLSQDIQQLFNFFQTSDFELILRLVWQASNVNRSLEIPDERTHAAYLRVRECLIQSVRGIHPTYQEVSYHLPAIYSFIKNFKTVVSLNYDLILYWGIMYGNGVNDMHFLKDCFVDRSFYEDWEHLRKSINGYRTTTLVFYPHGNLVLARNNVEKEFKVIANDDNDLLEAILRQWQLEEMVPLFVSEGRWQQKINSIQNSSYLNTVYREVLPNIGCALVIYGWDLGEQDLHILKRIASSRHVVRIAISVYGNNQAYCNRVSSIIREYLGQHVRLDFFHSNSPGCWNNVE